MGEGRSGFKIQTDKPTEIRLLRRPNGRLKDNIRMNHKHIGEIEIDSSQDRDYWRSLMNTTLILGVP